MPEATEVETSTSKAIRELRTKYGRVIKIEIDGKTLAFKPLDKAKITDMKRNMNKNPDLSLDISLNVCEFCCVFGASDFQDLANRYPLAFCGTEGNKGVIDYLMDLARGGASGPQISVE
jgi:hypothetical protein